DHLGEFLVGFEPLPLEASPPVLEEPVKAAIGIGKRTLGEPRQSGGRRGPSAFARGSGRDMLTLSLSDRMPFPWRGASPSMLARGLPGWWAEPQTRRVSHERS